MINIKSLLKFAVVILVLLSYSHCSKTMSNIDSQEEPRVRLSINKLNSQDIQDKIASDIALKLYNNLKELKGADRILYREVDGLDKSANRQLTGSISKLGKGYVLTVKILEGEKGQVLFNKTLMLKSVDDIDDEIEDIAEEISDDEDVWNPLSRPDQP